MLLNADYAAAQPGPRNYSKAWMRDGALSVLEYLRFGFTDVAKKYLEWFYPLVGRDGFVPFIVNSRNGLAPDWTKDWKEYDSQGQFAFALRTYYDYTRDAQLMAEAWPALERSMSYLTGLLVKSRAGRYKDTPYYGILPESNSHEGYFPGMHSYWDDFWALRGLEDAAYLARETGHKPQEERYRSELALLRVNLRASIKRVMARDKINYIPGCAEKGDFDPTSTANALTAAGQLGELRADPVLSKAMDAGFAEYAARLAPRFGGGVWGSYTPYEARNIEALIRLGRRGDALKLLDFMVGPSMRPAGWNLLAEVVHYDPATASYIGDMPHSWVGSDLIGAVRSILAYEEGGRIVIGAGVTAEWLSGAQEVAAGGFTMSTGNLGLTLRRTGAREVTLRAYGSARPERGLLFAHPFAGKVEAASVNGRPAAQTPDGVLFDGLPAEVVLQLKD
jgi:hypothetical protein